MAKISAEARERIRAEVAAIREAVMSGEPAPRPSAGKKPRVKREPKPRPVKYSREAVCSLFLSGKSVSQISAELGAHRSTVSSILTKAGHDPALRKGGPNRKEKCVRGHSMAEHGREVKGGGRYCAACNVERNRARYLRKKAQDS